MNCFLWYLILFSQCLITLECFKIQHLHVEVLVFLYYEYILALFNLNI